MTSWNFSLRITVCERNVWKKMGKFGIRLRRQWMLVFVHHVLLNFLFRFYGDASCFFNGNFCRLRHAFNSQRNSFEQTRDPGMHAKRTNRQLGAVPSGWARRRR